MLNKKFIFNLVTILLISLMAYRYLSSRLATTITTSQIRSNPFVALKSLSATTTTTAANNWSSAANMSSDHYATVSYVTTPNEDVARQLSRKLVEHRLAACVNIVKNIESIYEWKDKIEQDSEVLMIIKSNSQKSADLAKFVQDNHPYDCPEVVTVRVDSGSKPYLEWIHETINKEPLCAQK